MAHGGILAGRSGPHECYELHMPQDSSHTGGGPHRVVVIARRSGLGTAANLRALMRRDLGLTPSAYRRRFG